MNPNDRYIPKGYLSGPDAIYFYLIQLHRDETNAIRHLVASGVPKRNPEAVSDTAQQGESNVVSLPILPKRFEQIETIDRMMIAWRKTGEKGVRDMLFAGVITAMIVDPQNMLVAIPQAFWASVRADDVLFFETASLEDGQPPEAFFIPKEPFFHELATIYAATSSERQGQPATLPPLPPPPGSEEAELRASLAVRRPGNPSDLIERIKARMRSMDPAELAKWTWKELRKEVGEGERTTLTKARREVLSEMPGNADLNSR